MISIVLFALLFVVNVFWFIVCEKWSCWNRQCVNVNVTFESILKHKLMLVVVHFHFECYMLVGFSFVSSIAKMKSVLKTCWEMWLNELIRAHPKMITTVYFKNKLLVRTGKHNTNKFSQQKKKNKNKKKVYKLEPWHERVRTYMRENCKTKHVCLPDFGSNHRFSGMIFKSGDKWRQFLNLNLLLQGNALDHCLLGTSNLFSSLVSLL